MVVGAAEADGKQGEVVSLVRWGGGPHRRVHHVCTACEEWLWGLQRQMESRARLSV